MSDKPRRSAAQEIIDSVRGSVAGQAISGDRLEKARKNIVTQSANADTAAAAEFCERIVQWLGEEWDKRAFTLEQSVFSIALATINLRQNFPEPAGGSPEVRKKAFDAISAMAWEYYSNATKGT